MYRARLILVALTLVLLQAAYVGLVVMSGWLTWKYLLLMPAIFTAIRLHFVTIVLVGAPLVAGIVATFFLLKPLLSWRPAPENLLELRREDQPEFFEFVDVLCQRVGSPAPRTIAVDLQVNAAAGLRRGWLSLLTGDLTLTVGLPLVEGLTVRQFAGVLAHEFGHFSQKAGMRLYFLIGFCRYWFARVAYERDGWDETVDEWYENGSWQVKTLTGLAKMCVSGTRWVLQQLLKAADRVSASFSREMEFNADLHEAGLVGATVFEETSIRLVELNHALNRAWRSVEQTWARTELPDHFSHLVGVIDRNASGLDRAWLVESVMGEETQPLATHPATRDRIANVTGEAGVVPETGPWGEDVAATALFRDFEELGRQTSRAHYGRTLEGALQEARVVPVARYAETQKEYWQAVDALQTFFGGTSRPGRWFRLDLAEAGDPVVLTVGEPDATYWDLLTRWLNQSAGLNFMKAGGKIRPESFDLADDEIETAARAVEKTHAQLLAAMRDLRDRYRGVGLVFSNGEDLTEAYRLLSGQQEPLLELRRAFQDHEVLRQHLHLLETGAASSAQQEALARIDRLLAQITAVLLQSELLAPEVPKEAADLLNWSDEMGNRLLGQLALRQLKSVE